MTRGTKRGRALALGTAAALVALTVALVLLRRAREDGSEPLDVAAARASLEETALAADALEPDDRRPHVAEAELAKAPVLRGVAVLPAGTPADERVTVALAGGRHVAVEPDGSFALPLARPTRRAEVELAGRYLRVSPGVTATRVEHGTYAPTSHQIRAPACACRRGPAPGPRRAPPTAASRCGALTFE